MSYGRQADLRIRPKTSCELRRASRLCTAATPSVSYGRQAARRRTSPLHSQTMGAEKKTMVSTRRIFGAAMLAFGVWHEPSGAQSPATSPGRVIIPFIASVNRPATFDLDRDSANRWVSREGPEGVCGIVDIVTLHDTGNGRWTMETRKVATKQTAQRLAGRWRLGPKPSAGRTSEDRCRVVSSSLAGLCFDVLSGRSTGRGELRELALQRVDPCDVAGLRCGRRTADRA